MSTKVLIADDSPVITNLLVPFFTNEMGFEVVGIARDGNQAVELYEHYTPDLLTLDITMPNMSGIDAVTTIIQKYPHACIIVISAVGGDHVLECIAAGAAGFIQKPLKLQDEDYTAEFKKTIKGALEHTAAI